MNFEKWRDSVLKDITRLGFRATCRKYGLALSSLRMIKAGGEFAGLQSWKRLGQVKASQLRDPKKIKPIKTSL